MFPRPKALLFLRSPFSGSGTLKKALSAATFFSKRSIVLASNSKQRIVPFFLGAPPPLSGPCSSWLPPLFPRSFLPSSRFATPCCRFAAGFGFSFPCEIPGGPRALSFFQDIPLGTRITSFLDQGFLPLLFSFEIDSPSLEFNC